MNDVSAGTFEQVCSCSWLVIFLIRKNRFKWTMAKLGDGNYTFRNVGTGYWACARNDAVVSGSHDVSTSRNH